jgi:hypothetical protein
MKYLLIGLLLGAAFSAAHAQSTYDSNRAQELLNEQIQQQQRAVNEEAYQRRSLQLQQQ